MYQYRSTFTYSNRYGVCWSVSKLSTESVGSRRELVANCVHTANADACNSTVASRRRRRCVLGFIFCVETTALVDLYSILVVIIFSYQTAWRSSNQVLRDSLTTPVGYFAEHRQCSSRSQVSVRQICAAAHERSPLHRMERSKPYSLVFVMGFCVWNAVAFGDDSDDEHERMSEHRQRDCHQLRGMQHKASADEAADAESCRSGNHQRPAKYDKNTVQK